MLAKVVGCILILSASTGLGFGESLRMKKQIEDLETLKYIFVLMKKELEYTRAPFEEVFINIGKKCDGYFQMWLFALGQGLREKKSSTFETLWKNSIQEQLGASHLERKALCDLKNLGKSLGCFESIELYIEQLELEIKQKQEDYRTKKKLCQSMGVMGGIFLVIILL